MGKDISIRPETEKDYDEINELVIRSFSEGTNYSDGTGEVALIVQDLPDKWASYAVSRMHDVSGDLSWFSRWDIRICDL